VYRAEGNNVFVVVVLGSNNNNNNNNNGQGRRAEMFTSFFIGAETTARGCARTALWRVTFRGTKAAEKYIEKPVSIITRGADNRVGLVRRLNEIRTRDDIL